MADAIVTGEPRPVPYGAKVRANGWKFEVDTAALAQSETWAIAVETPLARHCALMSWLVSWGQTPCGSMPNSDLSFRALCGIPASLWPEVRDIVLRGWWLADDGRLYHDTLTKRVVEMLRRRRGDADRKALERAEKAARKSIDVAGMSGVTSPDSGATSGPDGSPSAGADVTRDKADVTQDKTDVTRDSAGVHPKSSTENGILRNTINQLRESVSRATQAGEGAHAGTHEGAHEDGPPDVDPPPGFFDAEPIEPAAPPPPITPAGAVGKAMRDARFPPDRIQLAHPKVATLTAAGATPELFGEVAAEAVRAGKVSMGWVLATVEGRMRDAAAPPPGRRDAAGKPPGARAAGDVIRGDVASLQALYDPHADLPDDADPPPLTAVEWMAHIEARKRANSAASPAEGT